MRYFSEEKRITIDSSELCLIAKRKVASPLNIEEVEICRWGEKPAELRCDFEALGYSFTLTALACISGSGELSIYTRVGDAKKPTRDEVAYARGKGYLAGYAFMKDTPQKKLSLTINYYSESDTVTVQETVTLSKLEAFYTKCITALSIYGAPEIERVTERIASIYEMKFPYLKKRDGQTELIRAVYRCISRSKTLFASAPTGTGKTVSTVYPALKAVGDGKIDKFFYLTPKTTTAEAVKECLTTISQRGAKLRAVILTAKERCCKRGLLCRFDRAECDSAECRELADAVLELFKLDKAVVTIHDAMAIAVKYTVCAHELMLCYSELCDGVICDLNYLFDPNVYLRRYFEGYGRYGLLIDEAHNLAERAREIYSSEISLDEIKRISECELICSTSKLKEGAEEIYGNLYELLMPYLRDEVRVDKDGKRTAFTHSSRLPIGMREHIDTLSELIDVELMIARGARDTDKKERILFLKEALRNYRGFLRAMDFFDEGYKLFLTLDGENIRIKLFNIDTGRLIKERIEHGHGAVFFSATLSPIEYYRSLLGGDRTSEVIEAGSPFDPAQLSVSIVDKISTRYSERERTLPAVCRTIAGVMAAKRGHYMVFAPSFEYCSTLARAFREKYPKIRILEHRKDMSEEQKQAFLREFSNDVNPESYLVGFSVMGGIYSEGIDLAGDSLIGAVVVGIGIPSISVEREAMAEYYEEKYESGKQYAYIYPGMNRVLQAAGRVIRREDDRGIIVLIDDRFDDPVYKKIIPKLWEGMRYVGDAQELNKRISEFWKRCEKERKS